MNNLVKNGDFSLGLQYWTLTYESSVSVLTENGLNFARIAYNGYFFHQNINVDPDATYEFSCLARTSSNLLRVYVGGRFLDNTYDTDVMPSMQFREYNISIETKLHTLIDVFILIEPNETNPEDAYADMTDVYLIKK
ncbi:hypothetical protein LU631_15150 [Erwinia tracheiphila]|uniref:CBM-cenC domain-containing protein n=1 Tax=Erwinia tracheiphila TaxID=65700 RepID=A0A0M2KCE5_9GAMM|nr:hypothetical protein [Erwinia tracheiphila]AXF75890.1 hypothetical protein AV903_07205 [Erwinia tracheiphila]EOS96894.1 hypothetical protein ETR_00305 [Erwinia tracheiphila PSU-1]KKF34671.1 hypothetical protein SY86_03190 [Erwinia tracheiphila]UIA85446.1 hypothetical protein LU604_12025 [Erwinia tracheiphila]UIA86343.1 hypothetical protein LU631_15150 [Erwinia tracheiphila]